MVHRLSTSSVVPLHFTEQGEGFPILCLHGHPGSGKSMAVFTQHLSQRFYTLAPDLRGYGRSQVDRTFAMTDHLWDLEALLNQRKIDRCLVLGWSLGGILAIELALRCPERVTGLILVATSARPWGSHPPITWQDNLFTAIAAVVNQIRPGCQWNINTFGRRSLFRYLVQQQTADTYHYLAHDAVTSYLRTSGHATNVLFKAIQQGYNRLPDVGRIACPSLVLAGAEDRHICAASSQETASALAKAEWICYSNTAHLFPWEIPAQVLADIDIWLERYPSVVSPAVV